MADRLIVDTDGLRSLSSTMTSIADSLDATRGLINGVRAEVGSEQVWDALSDFENHWDDGRGQIKKNMTAAREVLDEAARVYDETDAELANQLNEQWSGD